MPLDPSPTQAAAFRANGAALRSPVTEAGKARAARNGIRHGLCGGDFCLLPGEDGAELALLERAVAADWRPRDALERHWACELVTALWRQRRLRRLELTALAAADAEEVISEASLQRLQTLGRYGARLDGDIGRALRALRALQSRAGAEAPPRTAEPEPAPVAARPAPLLNPRTEPRMPEPERTPAAVPKAPAPPANRHERRRLEALARAAQRRAA